jgi:hypothetical protein
LKISHEYNPVRILLLASFALLFLGSTALVSLAASPSSSTPLSRPALPTSPSIKTYKCDDCWAGYNVQDATNGSVEGVQSNLVVPTLICSSTNTSASFLVGLDGLYTNDFATSGIYLNCVSGQSQYLAEVYDINTGQYAIASWDPSPGDHVTLSVAYLTSGNFLFKIKDHTNKEGFSETLAATSAALNSAECVFDTTNNAQGVNPVSQFSKASFKDCIVAADGVSNSIGSFSSPYTLYKNVCYNSAGTIVLATPSHLSDEQNFKVTWKATGP